MPAPDAYNSQNLPIEVILGIPTLAEKRAHHNKHKIRFRDALKKPEFFEVNALSILRAFAGYAATMLVNNSSEHSQLAVPALLVMFSLISDLYDGPLARYNEVCTDLGDFLDHGLGDVLMYAAASSVIYNSLIK